MRHDLPHWISNTTKNLELLRLLPVRPEQYSTTDLTVVANVNMIPKSFVRVVSPIPSQVSLPVICRDRPSVLHQAPLRPGFDSILAHGPDSLSPDHIFEVEGGTIVHDPFSDGCSAFGSNLDNTVSFDTAPRKNEKKRVLTPPAEEHIKSIANPQQ